MEYDARILESCRPNDVERWEFLLFISLVIPEGFALSGPEKAENIADN
jgi:hypothetical protein